MGLIGNFSTYTYTDHETETEGQQITYSPNIPADDPNYENRGQTVTVNVPLRYASKAARDTNIIDFEIEEHSPVFELPNGDRTEVQKSYDLLKTIQGFSNMVYS